MTTYTRQRTFAEKSADAARRRRSTPSGRMIRIPEVETLPCPAGGAHALRNVLTADDYLLTRCAGCKASWGALDLAARAEAAR